MLSIQAAITLVTLSQHNNVINLLWYLSDLSKNFYANLQINIVKSKFFSVLGMKLKNQLVLGDGIEPTTVGLTGHCSQPIIATSPYITQNLDMNRLTLDLHLSRKG